MKTSHTSIFSNWKTEELLIILYVYYYGKLKKNKQKKLHNTITEKCKRKKK